MIKRNGKSVSKIIRNGKEVVKIIRNGVVYYIKS